MKYKVCLIFILFAAGSFLPAMSQVFEKTRNESHSFRVFETSTLEIYNKYGNIHLFVWEKDSVRINVNVEVKSSKEQKAEKIFDYIDFEFSNSKYYIIARTQFRQAQGSFWAELNDLANTIFSGSNKTQIDYNIYLPANMDVKLENKFGNIYCTNHSGNFTVDLSNGDFRANDLTGNADLKLDFGNSSIHAITKGKIETGYGELEIDKSGDLEIDSKSSEIKIGSATSLKLNSRRDQFEINEISGITGEASFSYLTVHALKSGTDLKTDYGGISLKDISTDFQLIRINARYTDIGITLTTEFSGDITLEHSEATTLIFPEHFKSLSTEAVDQKNDRYLTSGSIGSPERNSGKIDIAIQSGKITFQDANQEF